VALKMMGLVAFLGLGLVFYLADGSDRYADRKNIKQRRRECWQYPHDSHQSAVAARCGNGVCEV